MNAPLVFSLDATHAGGAIETVSLKPTLTERGKRLFPWSAAQPPWSAVTERGVGTALDDPEHRAIVRAAFPLQRTHPKRCGAIASHRTPRSTTMKPTVTEPRYDAGPVAAVCERLCHAGGPSSIKL